LWVARLLDVEENDGNKGRDAQDSTGEIIKLIAAIFMLVRLVGFLVNLAARGGAGFAFVIAVWFCRCGRDSRFERGEKMNL
jgi:hypothetical protein